MREKIRNPKSEGRSPKVRANGRHGTPENLLSWKSFAADEIDKVLPEKAFLFGRAQILRLLVRDDDDLHDCLNYTMIQFAPEPGSRESFDAFVGRLLLANWDSASAPVHLSSDLALADLESATFFHNARLFLAALNEVGTTAATAAGYLNRVFVRQMFDRLILTKGMRETTLQVCKVLNEPDVWPFHVVRIVSECAGLVSRRGKVFRVTRPGRELLADAQAGILFRRLFIAHYRKFDLQYNFQFRAVPGIQETMAVILWRLDNVARDWTPVGGLAEQILLPGVLNQLYTAMLPYDKEAWVLGGYILNPLVELGLLQRKTSSDWPFKDTDEVRTTPLWRKFIQFDDWKEA